MFDLDECLTETDDCNANAACINNDGSYECECNVGFSGDGLTCDDINECLDGTAQCQANSACQNTVGSYECGCLDGYWAMGNTCMDINECVIPTLNDCDAASGASCINFDGGYSCECPAGWGGQGTTADPCADTLGECSSFDMEGYTVDPGCTATQENSLCDVQCDEANDYYDNQDGGFANYQAKCVCTGDRSDPSSLVCGWENNDPAATCNLCPAQSQITWFGSSTNDLVVEGVNGHLVDSRVEANEFVSSDWTTYTVYLMLPGDWSLARVFTWVFDVESMTVEDDGSSTLVVLKQNANSPTLTTDWSQFYVGFDNIGQFVQDGTALDYKVGVLPFDSSDSVCIMDHSPVSPEESASRKLPRKRARQRARQAARKAAGGN